MPLYEMIVVCRLGETQAIANLIKTLVVSIYQEGGVVRRFVNMGDRITQKNLKAKDGTFSSVARYLAVEFDANPETKSVAEKVARANSESLNVFTHKLKEMDYYKLMLNKEEWKQMEISGSQLGEKDKDAMISLLAKQVKESNLEDDLKSAIQNEIDKSKRI
jgi:ribosomal protein S6